MAQKKKAGQRTRSPKPEPNAILMRAAQLIGGALGTIAASVDRASISGAERRADSRTTTRTRKKKGSPRTAGKKRAAARKASARVRPAKRSSKRKRSAR